MEILVAVIVVLVVCFLIGISGFFAKNNSSPNTKLNNVSHNSNSILRLFSAKHVHAIADRFHSLEEVNGALRKAGLEDCNLIFGIDYTASNLHQGTETFDGRSLHAIQSKVVNPYQQVIKTLGKTLEKFDDDGQIPVFGFGDMSTKDKAVFSLRIEGFCSGFEDALAAYNHITPSVHLSGPTSFAPLIYRAIDIVKATRQYHILVIVADGQVTSERPTRAAIVEASHWPLSILLVGVGDGPWDMMQEFDDNLPERRFDNFQFVDFNRVLKSGSNPDILFALHALMEIPDQYKAVRELGLLDMD